MTSSFTSEDTFGFDFCDLVGQVRLSSLGDIPGAYQRTPGPTWVSGDTRFNYCPKRAYCAEGICARWRICIKMSLIDVHRSKKEMDRRGSQG